MTANNLRDLLWVAAAEGHEAVDLAEDAVAERIRRRRVRNRWLSGGGSVVAGAALVAGTLWAVLPGGELPPAATGAPRIVTSGWDSPSGMQAAFRTTLTVDANGCVRAGNSAVTLVWPRGYTVQGDAKSFRIVAGADKVVARSGVPLTISGGGGGHVQDDWTNQDCVVSGQIWMVGDVT